MLFYFLFSSGILKWFLFFVVAVTCSVCFSYHMKFSRPSKLISWNEVTHTYRRDRLTTNVLRRSVAIEEGTFNFILKITQNSQFFIS